MDRHLLCSIVVVVFLGVVCVPARAMRRRDNPVVRAYEQSSMPTFKMEDIKRRAVRRVEETEKITRMTERAKRFSPPEQKALDERVTALLDAKSRPGVNVEELRNDIRGLGAETREKKMVQQYLSLKLTLAQSSQQLRELTREYQELNAEYAMCRKTAELMKDESVPLVDTIMSLTKYLFGAGGAGIVALIGLGSKWRAFRLERKLKQLDIRIRTVQAEMEERKLDMGAGASGVS